MFEVCSVKDNWARRAGEITKCVQSQDLDSWFKTKCLYPCIRSSLLLLFCLDMLSCLEVSCDALYSYVQVATLAFLVGSQPRDFPCLCKGQASNITCRWWNAPVESWAGALAVRPGHVGPAEKQPIQPAVWHATSVLFRHVPWFSYKKPVFHHFPSFSTIAKPVKPVFVDMTWPKRRRVRYHSHPHITCFPSHVDLRTQLQYQSMDLEPLSWRGRRGCGTL